MKPEYLFFPSGGSGKVLEVKRILPLVSVARWG